MTCPDCGVSVLPGLVLCPECGCELSRAEPQGPDPEPGTPSTCPREGCGAPVPAGAACPYCGTTLTPVAASLRLLCPWGPVTVPPGAALRIGRGCDDLGLRTEVRRYGNVSREHAQITWDGSTAPIVTDLKSTNGTWLNGRRLPHDRPDRLSDGDVLRFGADLEVRVVLS